MYLLKAANRTAVLLLIALWSRSAQASPALQLDSVTTSAGTPAILTVSLNRDVMGACGLLLAIGYGAPIPSTAPALYLGVNEQDLADPFKGALFGSATPAYSSPGLPTAQWKLIGIVHAVPVDGPADRSGVGFQERGRREGPEERE